MASSLRRLHFNGDTPPRSIKKRKLDRAEDGLSFHPLSPSQDVSPPAAAETTALSNGTVKLSDLELAPSGLDMDHMQVQTMPNGAGNDAESTDDIDTRRNEVPTTRDGTAIDTTPRKRKRGRPPKSARAASIGVTANGDTAHAQDGENSSPATSTRQSGRLRRRPRRYSDEIAPTPERSLWEVETPIKDRNGSVRKTVTFREGTHDGGGSQLGFKDIPPLRGDSGVVGDPGGAGKAVNGREVSERVNDGASPPKRKRGRPRKDIFKATVAKEPEELAGRAQLLEDASLEDEPPSERDAQPHCASQLIHLLESPDLSEVVPTMRNIILEKLTGRRKLRPVGLEDEYKKVQQLVRQTVIAGEGNSLLVIGARGSGKSMVRLASLVSVRLTLLTSVPSWLSQSSTTSHSSTAQTSTSFA